MEKKEREKERGSEREGERVRESERTQESSSKEESERIGEREKGRKRERERDRENLYIHLRKIRNNINFYNLRSFTNLEYPFVVWILLCNSLFNFVCVGGFLDGSRLVK